jgi:xyloglucan:xyloglucosyl transferase
MLIYDRFYVDDIAIRKYPRRVSSTYPLRPLWVYGTIWDASSWATENGKYRADYRYQPFVAKFSKFILSGCPASDSTCSAAFSNSLISTGTGGLTSQERSRMKSIQRNNLVYNYCKDRERYPTRLPECGKRYAPTLINWND